MEFNGVRGLQDFAPRLSFVGTDVTNAKPVYGQSQDNFRMRTRFRTNLPAELTSLQ